MWIVGKFSGLFSAVSHDCPTEGRSAPLSLLSPYIYVPHPVNKNENHSRYSSLLLFFRSPPGVPPRGGPLPPVPPLGGGHRNQLNQVGRGRRTHIRIILIHVGFKFQAKRAQIERRIPHCHYHGVVLFPRPQQRRRQREGGREDMCPFAPVAGRAGRGGNDERGLRGVGRGGAEALWGPLRASQVEWRSGGVGGGLDQGDQLSDEANVQQGDGSR